MRKPTLLILLMSVLLLALRLLDGLDTPAMRTWAQQHVESWVGARLDREPGQSSASSPLPSAGEGSGVRRPLLSLKPDPMSSREEKAFSAGRPSVTARPVFEQAEDTSTKPVERGKPIYQQN
jgi:hypothetical protein